MANAILRCSRTSPPLDLLASLVEFERKSRMKSPTTRRPGHKDSKIATTCKEPIFAAVIVLSSRETTAGIQLIVDLEMFGGIKRRESLSDMRGRRTSQPASTAIFFATSRKQRAHSALLHLPQLCTSGTKHTPSNCRKQHPPQRGRDSLEPRRLHGRCLPASNTGKRLKQGNSSWEDERSAGTVDDYYTLRRTTTTLGRVPSTPSLSSTPTASAPFNVRGLYEPWHRELDLEHDNSVDDEKGQNGQYRVALQLTGGGPDCCQNVNGLD
ncbi:hypothetical protein MKZ38_008715 [Zalerion maritima]|uniref:Uncharacterized protein n=1 Tax=Zalerion maritima TaxID=339359 RepID=A0AAD5RU00_9PEZI|nr:hypothetical protein MKZ38_008715 [Zalerion maritima]